jgi:hypothetical protein
MKHLSIIFAKLLNASAQAIVLLAVVFLFHNGNAQEKVTSKDYGLTTDFEDGTLRGWTIALEAFKFQPTLDDNPAARRRGQASQHQGRYWINTYEKYQGLPGQKPGEAQGDAPIGYMYSEEFIIDTPYISFLIGGSDDDVPCEVALQVENNRVRQSRSKDMKTLQRIYWEVSPYRGKKARIIVEDYATNGHISFDDLQFLTQLPPNVLPSQIEGEPTAAIASPVAPKELNLPPAHANALEALSQQLAQQAQAAQKAVAEELQKQGLGELAKQMQVEKRPNQIQDASVTLAFVTKMVELKAHAAYLNQLYATRSAEFKQKVSYAIMREELILRSSNPDSDIVAIMDWRRKMAAEQNSAVFTTFLGGFGNLFEAEELEQRALSERGGYDEMTESWKEDYSEQYRQEAQEARERAITRGNELMQRSSDFGNAIAVAEKALFEKIKTRYGYKEGERIIAALNSYWHDLGTPVYKSYADWQQTKMKGRTPETARDLGSLGEHEVKRSGYVTPTLWQDLYTFHLAAPSRVTFSSRLDAEQQSRAFHMEIYEVLEGQYFLKQTPDTLHKSVELPAGEYLLHLLDHTMSLVANYELKIASVAMPAVTPAMPVTDDFFNWMIGEWEGKSTSFFGKSREWHKIEWESNGKSIAIHNAVKVSEIDPYWKKSMSKEAFDKTMNTVFKSRGTMTMAQNTGEFAVVWSDSMNTFKGSGKRTGNVAIMTLEGQFGRTIRTIEKVSHDKMVMTIKSKDPAGNDLESHAEFTRQK